MFNMMPISALIDDKILCMHGGLSPELLQPKQIFTIERPTDVPDIGLLCDLLWSDPKTTDDKWEENERGVSFTFNENVVEKFCEKNEIDLVCRGHLVVDDGYEFFANRKLVTIFSAPNYCAMFENDGCLMKVAADLTCSFSILKPQRIPEFKICVLNSFEIGNPKSQQFLKSHISQKGNRKTLVENDNIYADEHQVSLKTNKGAQHMNMWVKPNPSFDTDDALEKYLGEASGLMVMFDSPFKYSYQDIPKFLIYALVMYMPNFGNKSQLPFIVVGKKDCIQIIDPK